MYSQSVAGGVGEILADAEVAFGRQDGLVAERKLDLLKRRAAAVGELGEGATEVVGSNRQPELFGIAPHDQINSLGSDAGALHFPALGDGPE